MFPRSRCEADEAFAGANPRASIDLLHGTASWALAPRQISSTSLVPGQRSLLTILAPFRFTSRPGVNNPTTALPLASAATNHSPPTNRASVAFMPPGSYRWVLCAKGIPIVASCFKEASVHPIVSVTGTVHSTSALIGAWHCLPGKSNFP